VSRYQLAIEAEMDLEAIVQQIAVTTGPRAALRVEGTFRQAFGTLAEAPRAGHARPDLTERPYLFWPVWSYLIVYDPEAEPLLIMRIIHGARDIGQIFD
jgi:plasmid stabilization system protein ParE